MVFIPYFFEGLMRGQAIIFGFKITVFIAIIIILYCIYISIYGLGKTAVRGKKSIIRFFLVYNALYFPVLLFEYYWNFNFQNMVRPISFGNLFYFVLNLMTVIFISGNFFIPRAKITLESVSEDILKQYKLTPREKEIIILISKGLTHKMMASELGIATLTVKNHIYNIYQKTKAVSKIDLINKISRGNPSQDSNFNTIFS
jgi:DNA-binding CsgD family transcriptional regulator